MFPLDPKHFVVVGFFHSWVSFYFLLKNQNWTLKVHKYLILQRKVWLSRWGVHPTHDLKHFMATFPCKSHRWQKPSCILKCFVTFLTPESNFSCGRLSQRYVLTNPYRSGLKADVPVPLHFYFPLGSLESGQTRSCGFQGPHPTLPNWGESPVCVLIQADRAREACASQTTWTAPQGHPRCKLSLQMAV